MSEVNRYVPDYAVAPGDVLDEHLQASAMTQAELAGRLGLSGKHVNRIIAGHEPITPETALKLEPVFGLGAHIWLNLEARFREHRAREEQDTVVEKELYWLECIPHKSMAKLGWIPHSKNEAEIVRLLREFFRVSSLEYLSEIWGGLRAVYRSTPAFESHEWALVAWLNQGDRLAEAINGAAYNAASLKAQLPTIRPLSCLPGVEFLQPLVNHCSAVGVAIVFVPPPDGVRVCGATRWHSSDKVIVQLSLRYKTDDQLWFTIFHEFGHVLLHAKKGQYIDFERVPLKTPNEVEADRFAAQMLIDPSALEIFRREKKFSKQSICAFADLQRVSPGIVVGQLQHLGDVPFASNLNHLKKRFAWKEASGA